jgi:hypothetical protein
VTQQSKRGDLVHRPEELVYRSCYASVDLKQLLESAETRSSIRKLPPAQLFFSLKELDETQLVHLLPHITEEQWATVLDLDLWTKDELNPDRFIAWQKYILVSEDPVARKIIRATDFEAWALSLKAGVRIFARQEDGEFSEEAIAVGRYETPDGNFFISLPRNPEKARVYQQLVQRLYQLDSDFARGLLDSCRYQTSMELREEAYQNRRRRIEDLGFQDYFDAIEIYTARSASESIPEKKHCQVEAQRLPSRLKQDQTEGPMLLFRSLASIQNQQETETLVEELFFVCNKLLSADRISPDASEQLKIGILKAISSINLGLDCWSGGDLGKAADGISRHYLLSFFQIGYGKLVELRQAALHKLAEQEPIPGTFYEAAMESLTGQFPELAEQAGGKIGTRFFQTRKDLDWAQQLLHQLG